MFIAHEDALFSCMYVLKDAAVSHHMDEQKQKDWPHGKGLDTSVWKGSTVYVKHEMR